MEKLEPIVDGMFKKGILSVDDVDMVNNALLQAGVGIDQFKAIIAHATMKALAEKLVREKIRLTPLLLQVLEIRYQELTDQDLVTKGEVLKSAEKIWENMDKPLSVSAIIDPEILSLVAIFTIPENILQEACFGIKVNSMFADPNMGRLEMDKRHNKELKIFTKWSEYAENLKGGNSLVLLGGISVVADIELAKKRLLQLITSGVQVATPIRLPHLFKKNDWVQLEEAMQNSLIPDGEPVLYLENMVIKKPFNLDALRRNWEIVYRGCSECPSSTECAPEVIF